jgi:hypothetical protein
MKLSASALEDLDGCCLMCLPFICRTSLLVASMGALCRKVGSIIISRALELLQVARNLRVEN